MIYLQLQVIHYEHKMEGDSIVIKAEKNQGNQYLSTLNSEQLMHGGLVEDMSSEVPVGKMEH